MGVPHESETLESICDQASIPQNAEFYAWADIRRQLIWRNIFLFGFYHLVFVTALIIYTFGLNSVPVKWQSIAWGFAYGQISSFGVTAGAHRLWTHRAYKATLPLRMVLILLYSAVGLNSIFHWVKDHRVHHKYSETDADPHNAKRGFFFAHIGWLLMKRHPEYIIRGRNVDMSDIVADPVVMFEKKYHFELTSIFCYIIPSSIPVIFWQETLMHAILIQCFVRYVVTLHCIWSVNSLAHFWGDRPYNKFINPTENMLVSLATLGEGSHNYHHTFPWDYKASEFPYLNFNAATLFIDMMAKIGWAYDRREPSPEFVKKIIQRIGSESENQ